MPIILLDHYTKLLFLVAGMLIVENRKIALMMENPKSH